MRLLCDFGLEIGSSWRRRIIVMVSAMLLAMAMIFLMVAIDTGIVHCPRLASTVGSNKPSSLHRKLLRRGSKMKMEEPNRIWGEKCTKADIVINQGPTAPLPNGIPTYSVEIMNVCVTGCDIFSIHLNCGWFSSARLINPKIFKRLRYNDCLVNDGKPLTNGDTLSFKYANTYLYPLSVNSVSC